MNIVWWIVCGLLGFITVVFSPMVVGVVIRFLMEKGKKYPELADIIPVLTLIIVGCVLIGMIAIFTMVYHHLFFGTP